MMMKRLFAACMCILLVALAVGIVFAEEAASVSQGGASGDENNTSDTDGNNATNEPGPCKDEFGCPCDCSSGTSEEEGTGCLHFAVSLGGPVFPGALQPLDLFVTEETPTADLSTPAGLNYARDARIASASTAQTEAGEPQTLYLVNRIGETVSFSFADGATTAMPGGRHSSQTYKLVMVDSNGTAVVSSPAYYDRILAGGNRERYAASTNEYGIRELVSVITSTGGEMSLADSGIEVIKSADQNLRQILAPECLADIVTNSAYQYTIDLYASADAGSKTNGLYVPTGSAFTSFTIENPDTTNSIDRLKITKVSGSKTNITEFSYTGHSDRWVMTREGTTYSEVQYSFWNDAKTVRYETTEVRDGDTVVSKVQRRYDVRSWSQELTWERGGDTDSDLLTTNEYYTTASETGRYSRLKSTVRPDGSWTTYDYDSQGRASMEVRSWKDVAFGAASNAARAVYYSYTPVDADDTAEPADARPRSVIEVILGEEVNRTYYAYATNTAGERVDAIERCSVQADAYGSTNSQRMVTTYYHATNSIASAGKTKTVAYSDGRQETYTYEFGTYDSGSTNCWADVFAEDPDGDDYRVTVVQGTTNNADGIANETTRRMTIYNNAGKNVMKETYVYTGGSSYDKIAWAVRSFDARGNAIEENSSTGGKYEADWGDNCCGKESETDRSGIERTFSYNLLKQMITMVKKGTNSPSDDVTQTFAYDVADRRLSTTLSGGGTSLLVSSNSYDVAGRLEDTTDARGLTTTYQYPNGGRDSIVEMPGSETNHTQSYLDGRTKSVTGNALVHQYSDYGANADGTQWSISYTGPDGTNSPMWVKTTTDMLGRTIKQERPGYGGSTLTNESFFNSVGQLAKSTSPGMADMLYVYNELGEQIRSGLDIDDDGSLTLASTDRISESDTVYEQDSGDWYRVSTSATYPGESSSASLTNATSWSRLTGLSGSMVSESGSVDVFGQETISLTAIDRTSKTVTQTIDYPDSTNDAVSVSINGLAVSSSTKTGLQYGYGFDGIGRRITTTDPRTGTSTTYFNSQGQVSYVEDATTNKTSYAYSPTTGRRIAVTNALGKVVRYGYTTRGEFEYTWGDTASPVAYSFNDYGRMDSMTTYRSGTNWSSGTWPGGGESGDTTQWLYEEATGLLTNKLYANGNGTSYTYTEDGKLETRVWARGITTTYSHDPCCRAITNISYSDSTPDISFTYNRIGQQVTVEDAQGTRTFSYNPSTLVLTNETIVAGGVTSILARTQDSYGRPDSLSFGSDYQVDYGYSGVGRFETVDSVVLGVTNNWQYSYLDNSELIENLVESNAGVTNSRSYEANRNLITEIHNQAQGVTISKYQYSNDALGRRTQRIDTTASVTTNDFGYDARSQLTNVVMGAESFAWAFDNIGNRETYTTNGTTYTYLANELNQYTNIANGTTNDLTWDLDGNLLTDGKFTSTWNGNNRLVAVEPISPSNGSKRVDLDYDYVGRRFKKIVSTYNGSSWDVTSTNLFYYDGWNPIAEAVSSDSGETKNYWTHGLDLSGTMQDAGGIGGMRTWTRSSDTNTFLYFADANGNITELTDTSNPTNIVARYQWDAYGDAISSSGVEADNNVFRYGSKYFIVEIEWYDFGYRPYITYYGRFPSPDPLYEPATRLMFFEVGIEFPERILEQLLAGARIDEFNTYSFVNNHPSLRVDLLGLKECCGSTVYDPDKECCVKPDDVKPKADNPKVCIRPLGFAKFTDALVHCFIDIGGGDFWNYGKGNKPHVEPDPHAKKARCVPLDCGDKCLTEDDFRNKIEEDRNGGNWDPEDYDFVRHNCCHWIDQMLKSLGCKGTEDHFPGYTLPTPDPAY